MHLRQWLPIVILFPIVPGFGASREILDLQRDVAQIQDQLRSLQQSQDQRLAALTTLAQQALDAANKANTSVSVLESGIRQNLREQEKNVVAPVAGVGLRLDQMTTGVQSLHQSVADITSLLGKLQQQVTDLSNAVRSAQTPAAPPPPPGQEGSAALAPASSAPPVPAETLYANAMRDRSGGKADLALSEFGDYVKYYSNTDLAPRAQFYIAEIHYQRGDFDAAMREFETVVDRYPSNDLTADALYMKGMSQIKLGRPTQGQQTLQTLIKKYPTSAASTRACNQIKTTGLSCGAALDR
jgi:tol-pal system protein YbgF